MPELKLVFGIRIDKIPKGMWSFGICLSHSYEETYIYINLFKITISVGRLYKGRLKKQEEETK